MVEIKEVGHLRAKDSFGCSVNQLDDDRNLVGSGISFHRKASVGGSFSQVVMPAAREGFLLGVSLEGGHTRTIFETGKTAKHEFAIDTIYARNLEDDYKADLKGAFNFVLIELSASSLKELADGADLKGITELKRVQASPDPVFAALARAIFSTRAEGREPSALFLDQIALALGSHIVHTYGNGNLAGSSRRRTLSRKNEVRAKELMRSRLDGNLSVAELASECNLSQGGFHQSFPRDHWQDTSSVANAPTC